MGRVRVGLARGVIVARIVPGQISLARDPNCLAIPGGRGVGYFASPARRRLVEPLGTQIVIENQPTGGGVAAAKAVLSSPPDGHTLALLSNATAVSAALFKKLPYDPLADFVPVGGISDFSYVFLTNAKSELRTLQDVIAAARANPGELNFGTAAAGTSPNLTALLFRKVAGIDFTVVPFRGATDLTVALFATTWTW